jgi:hypothetical protein
MTAEWTSVGIVEGANGSKWVLQQQVASEEHRLVSVYDLPGVKESVGK